MCSGIGWTNCQAINNYTLMCHVIWLTTPQVGISKFFDGNIGSFYAFPIAVTFTLVLLNAGQRTGTNQAPGTSVLGLCFLTHLTPVQHNPHTWHQRKLQHNHRTSILKKLNIFQIHIYRNYTCKLLQSNVSCYAFYSLTWCSALASDDLLFCKVSDSVTVKSSKGWNWKQVYMKVRLSLTVYLSRAVLAEVLV